MAKLDLLRIYDTAVMDWLQGEDRLKVKPVLEKGASTEPEAVPVVFATPERVEGGVRGEDWRGEGAKSKVPYPYMALTRLAWTYDWNRRNTTRIRYVQRSGDLKSIVVGRFPFPIDLFYQVDFYSRLRTHANLATMWFAEQFPFEGGEGRLFTIDFQVPWGKKWVHAFLQELRDLTEYEPDEDDREIHITCRFVLKGHLFECFENFSDISYDPGKITYRLPTIHAATVELVTEDEPDKVIDSFTIEEQFDPEEFL